MELQILFEDEYIIAVEKPAGILVEPIESSSEETLLNMVRKQWSELVDFNPVVHRLDRDTSGIIVFPKTQEVQKSLEKIFREHQVHKTYLALLHGELREDDLKINAPLLRLKKSFRRTTDESLGRGEKVDAETSLHVIKRYEDMTLVELYPTTGRTHQLRAHMEHIGHPIVGDVIYGKEKKKEVLHLHAYKLSFELFGKIYNLSSEIPLWCPGRNLFDK